jgi:hypothetical protein
MNFNFTESRRKKERKKVKERKELVKCSLFEKSFHLRHLLGLPVLYY